MPILQERKENAFNTFFIHNLFLNLQTMINRLIHIPGYAYVTEDKGCKLKYGQQVYIKYVTPDGKYAVTKGGKYEAMRFSPTAPSLEMFEKPKKYSRVMATDNHKNMKSFRQLYYELLDEGRSAFLNGTSVQFTGKLFNYK